MTNRLYFGIDLVDRPIGIDEIGDPEDALIFTTDQLLGPPGTIGFQHVMRLITQQGILEVVFFNKLLLFFGRVCRCPDNLDPSFLEFLEFITESLAFDDSTRCGSLGEKPEDKPTALEVAERDFLLIGIG